MTANKATRLDPGFAVALAEGQPALAAWRKQRKPPEAIPEPLWHDLVRSRRPVERRFSLHSEADQRGLEIGFSQVILRQHFTHFLGGLMREEK